MDQEKRLYNLSIPADLDKKNRTEYGKSSSSSESFLYKYCGLDVAILALNEKRTKLKLRFIEPIFWKDPVESQIYLAEFPERIKNKVQKVFACCVTKDKLSEAAWITYGYDKTGIGARCVKFSLISRALRNVLAREADRNGYTLYEGDVEYVDMKQLMTIKDPTSNIYKRFINADFTIETFLHMLLLKRDAYRYENETRFFLVKKETENNSRTKSHYVDSKVEKEHYVDLEIDIDTVVNKVYHSESCDKAEIKILQEYYGNKVEASTLYKERDSLVIP